MSKTHVIDGVTYVEVDREAKEGEKIIGRLTGNVYDVILEGGCGKVFTEGGGYVRKRHYFVLEPLEAEEPTVDGTQASEQVIEMLANLARRVTQLESQLRDTQRNVERQAEDLENARHRINDHSMMFGEFDERTQVINAIAKFYKEERR